MSTRREAVSFFSWPSKPAPYHQEHHGIDQSFLPERPTWTAESDFAADVSGRLVFGQMRNHASRRVAPETFPNPSKSVLLAFDY